MLVSIFNKKKIRNKKYFLLLQDLDGVSNTADEMEMFAMVSRKYKHFFIKQEHLFTFRTYDMFEVSVKFTGARLRAKLKIKLQSCTH
jgi:hypothetical protein